MRIPTIGTPVLFVLLAGDKEKKRDPILRPAQIVSVSSYDANQITCNLIVNLDGDNDDSLVSKLNMNRQGWQAWATSVQYSTDMKLGTFHYKPSTYDLIETFTVRDDITHGRETIKAGAKGTWDQSKDTITFDRLDVTGLHVEDLPIYPAEKFIDLHCARLDAPNGYGWFNIMLPNDGSETPDERLNFQLGIAQRDMFRMARAYERGYNALARITGQEELMVEELLPPTPPQQAERASDRQRRLSQRQGMEHLSETTDDSEKSGDRPRRMELSEHSSGRLPQHAGTR